MPSPGLRGPDALLRAFSASSSMAWAGGDRRDTGPWGTALRPPGLPPEPEREQQRRAGRGLQGTPSSFPRAHPPPLNFWVEEGPWSLASRLRGPGWAQVSSLLSLIPQQIPGTETPQASIPGLKRTTLWGPAFSWGPDDPPSCSGAPPPPQRATLPGAVLRVGPGHVVLGVLLDT